MQAHKLIPLQMVVSLAPYASFAFLTSFGIISQPNWYFYSVVNNVSLIYSLREDFEYNLLISVISLKFTKLLNNVFQKFNVLKVFILHNKFSLKKF